MAWPADSFLPAKGILKDTPITDGDKFYLKNYKQLEGVAAMCTERCMMLPIEVINPKPRLFKVAIVSTGGPPVIPGFGFTGGQVFHPWASYISKPTPVFHSDSRFDASPWPGYEFVSWSGDYVSTNPSITVPDGDAFVVNLYANFKKTGDPNPPLASGDIIPDWYSGCIDFIRTFAETAIPYFINTDVHPDGDISGAAAVTYWTKATLFASLGIGIGGDWTRTPARNPYGYAPSAGPLNYFQHAEIGGFPLMWVEHINELYQILHNLKYITRTTTFTDQANRSGSKQDATSCDDVKSRALGEWEAASWSGTSGSLLFIQLTTERVPFTEDSDSFTAVAQNRRGKVRCDLTDVKGSGRTFLKLEPLSSGGSYSNLEPEMVGDTNFHQLDSFTVDHDEYKTRLLADFEPGFSTNCPLNPPGPIATEGWVITDSKQVVVFAPDFGHP